MSITQQKALFLQEPRGNFVIQTKDVPTPGHGEILVKIHAIALNNAEWKIQKFALPFITKYPVVLGSDTSGVVEAVGEGVQNFSKDDRVSVIRVSCIQKY